MLLQLNERLSQTLNADISDRDALWTNTLLDRATTDRYMEEPPSEKAGFVSFASYRRMGAYFVPRNCDGQHLSHEGIGLAHSKGITDSSGEQYIAMSQRGMGLVAGIHAELLHASTARTMGIDAYPLVMAQRQSGVGSPTCADVVLDDLEVLLPDVHDVPLDEIISFRAQHGAEFRA